MIMKFWPCKHITASRDPERKTHWPWYYCPNCEYVDSDWLFCPDCGALRPSVDAMVYQLRAESPISGIRVWNMSFALTTAQILDETKTVTRRMGWLHLMAGDYICACEKCQGLKPKEQLCRLKLLRCLHVNRELVNDLVTYPRYGRSEIAKEGFAQHPTLKDSQAWVDWFCKTHHCQPDSEITRIQFQYIHKI